MTGKLICKSCGGSPDAHAPTCAIYEPEPAKRRTDCGYVVSVSQSRIALLEAKERVCDAYVRTDPNNTTGVQEVYDARVRLLELQEKAK